jgi:dinuclear metal center YbgI/SA1388 family protein
MRCQELCDRLDDELETDAYAEIDASANGLQVGSGEREISRVAVAVDAAVETVERASDAGADLLVAHHGISWGGIDRVTGREYRRIAALIENDLSLYAAHLPLDGHQTLGNAARIGDLLGLDDREPFGRLGGEFVGQRGRLPDAVTVERLCDRLRPELATGDGGIRSLAFGPEQVSDVAIVTGSGVDWLDEALDCGADVLLTGEGKQNVYHEARESGIHVVLGGHYATETFGVRALQELVGEWGLDTTYIDCPTGL